MRLKNRKRAQMLAVGRDFSQNPLEGGSAVSGF